MCVVRLRGSVERVEGENGELVEVEVFDRSNTSIRFNSIIVYSIE